MYRMDWKGKGWMKVDQTDFLNCGGGLDHRVVLKMENHA